MKKTALIITAAGQGLRFGGNIPKQFIKIGDKTILQICCNKFKNIPEISEIIITSEKSQLKNIENQMQEIGLVCTIIEGGATRAESVYNAFKILKNTDSVMIHDAVRPHVSEALIQGLLKEAKNKKAVIPVIPITDTVKFVENNKVMKTMPREKLFCVQTPQIFDFKLLSQAYAKALLGDAAIFTDEAKLIEEINENVYIIPGETSNMKITTKEDLH
jgi:2-C-methyl-D-erythritol 4-phosphate cytidylyltransferase